MQSAARRIRSEYDIHCKVCRKKIPAGSEAVIAPYKGAKTVVHGECEEEASKLQFAPPSSVRIPVAKKKTGIMPVSLIGPPDKEYLPYQEEGIRFMLEHETCLLADEMGLGKTVQAIGLINQLEKPTAICIVCPTSLRYNWRYELSQWLREDKIIHYGFFPEVGNPFNVDIIIVPYSQLDKIPPSYTAKLLIVDEAHYVKNPRALRTKRFRSLVNKCEQKVFLTGTPIENRAEELWPLLQFLDPYRWDPPAFYRGKKFGPGEGAGWIRFAKRYCGAHTEQVPMRGKRGLQRVLVTRGSTNLDELNRILKSTIMLRRLKSDVLNQLPEKQRQMVLLPTPPELAETIVAEHKALAATGLDYESDVKQLHEASIQFSELAAARKKTGIAKIPYVIEHIERCLANGVEKIVVLCHHKEVVWQIAECFGYEDTVTFTGDHSEEMRNAAVERFQRGNAKLFIGTIGAAGVGLTLTAASLGIFAEFEWKDMSQAEDRLHRLGQKVAVLWQYLVFDNSVDSNMLRTLWRKKGIIEKALN